MATGRGLKPEVVEQLSDGRAYLGEKAGDLIDELASSWEQAIEIVSADLSAKGNAMSRASAAAVQEAANKAAPTTQTAPPAAATLNLNISTGAPPPVVAKKDEEKEAGADKLATIHKALDDAKASANNHRDAARKALDAANEHSGDPAPDTSTKAKECMKAMDAADDESGRAKKAWLSIAGDPDDDDEDGDEGGDHTVIARMMLAMAMV